MNAAIAERLRAAREAHGLNQKQLAALTGGQVDNVQISDYEQGLRRLSVESAVSLAEALGDVTAAYLLCLDEDQPKLVLAETEERLLETYRATDARGQDVVLAVAEYVALGSMEDTTRRKRRARAKLRG
ncbi:helix-turn-helix transcriptional regulator [Thiohalocapsa marina]|uniref:Helix-turn-helix transcriptional regulator n=1 Tax=Thiohalocapsa marina TaxID=424902 RepID=A0A5M8FIE2_9GAMM|nr:helix-turn-helix transcriptional regulator [Thiohalocapsa marina]